MFCKIAVLKNFCKIHRKTSELQTLFNNVQTSNLNKTRPQYRCFPIKFTKLLSTPVLHKSYKRLLLTLSNEIEGRWQILYILSFIRIRELKGNKHSHSIIENLILKSLITDHQYALKWNFYKEKQKLFCSGCRSQNEQPFASVLQNNWSPCIKKHKTKNNRSLSNFILQEEKNIEHSWNYCSTIII